MNGQGSGLDTGYLNQKYVSEVELISRPNHRENPLHDNAVCDEQELITHVKLTSSEKEAYSHRRSRSDDSESSSSKENHLPKTDTDHDGDFNRTDQTRKTSSEATDEDEEAEMFYEMQIDESSLINYAKLTDDGIEEENILEEKADIALKLAEARQALLRDVNIGDAEADITSLDLQQDYLVDNGEGLDGLITPVNSVADDKLDVTDNVFVADDLENGDDTLNGATSKPKPDVPHDVDFSRLIQGVVSQLAYFDMDEILSLFAGTGVLEEGVLSDLTSVEELMDVLQEYRFVSRDNMYHLQNLIMRLDDSDLYTQAVQYTRHHLDIIFFYQELEETPKGFDIVRCFVSGRDFTRLTRESIELVRFKIASLLFMPAHFIYVVGIEPGQKVIISLMLMERYAQELSEMVKEGLPELCLVSVNAVQIRGKIYSTAGTTAAERYYGEGHTAFLSVYQQLREKTKHLEEKEEEIKELREDAEFTKLELETMSAELELLTEKAVHESVDRQIHQHVSRGKRVRTRSFPGERSGPLSFSTRRSPRMDSEVSEANRPEGSKSGEQHCYLSGNVRTGCQLPKSETQGVHEKLLAGMSVPHAILSQPTEDLPDASRTASTAWRYKPYTEKDVLMDEIQAILDELAFVQAFT